MQLVPDKYYIWYNQIAAALGAILAALALASWMVPFLATLHTHWGFTPVTVVVGLIQLIYGLVLFKRQSSPWVGAFLATLTLSILTIGLIHNSGQLHSWLLALWAMQVLAAGIFGLYAVVGCGFLATIYYVLIASGPGQQKLYDPFAIGAILGTYLLGAISYTFWKRLYVDHESRQVSQLTGQLRSNQQQAEILIQSIADGIIVTDIEGKITLLNPAAGKMTGWPIDEALGIDIQQVAKLAQEDGKDLPEGTHPFKQVVSASKQYEHDLQLIDREDKNHRVVSLVISPIVPPKSKAPVGAVGVFRDVSASREEEHRRADFISTASHEMRTPVAAIEGYLALALNDKVSKIDTKARDFLIKAHESTQRLGKLFQDLLTSAKAEDGRLVNHPVVVEMGAYLEQITDGLRFAAEKKGLIMDFTVGTGEVATTSAAGGKVVKPLYYAHIDPDRMREVITNLFDNAVKYSESGKITIALTANNDVIQFFIRDTGHGIPPEDIAHLFQKFYRVDNSTTRTIGGTGLGLFISRKIVELYNGRIWVESEVNKGSIFYINLPRLSTQRASELQATESHLVL
jgi:two-component system, OmpR family, sensor histidine kinase VicK